MTTHRSARRDLARSIFVAASPALHGSALSAGTLALVAFGAVLLGACNGPRTIHERPILVTGQRVPNADEAAAGAAERAAAEQRAAQGTRDSIAALAAADCAPAVCTAITRGEIAVGMSETQVLAATRSTPAAWSVRRSAGATVLVPASLATAPRDVVGEVALVQLAGGRVASYGYREPQGVRLVASAADATPEGRARATAEALVREGDELNAAGNRELALDRYDRALVLRPDDAMLQYRVATLLDLQLRPIEALMRYQRFLTQLEIQRIDAVGNANAKLAEAIARAQQRIIVLERQAR
jgi:tetratricopeptide (TPR) repeat protein